MEILLCNDDGIQAPGLVAMADALRDLGQVTVIAPDRERSAASHSLTLFQPLRAREVAFPVPVKKAWAIDGTPSDCAKLGMGVLLPALPDIVVSGINHGPNMCVDVFYSGTVGAAFEGAFSGIPSFAVSLNDFQHGASFVSAARWGCAAINAILADFPEQKIVYNINVPGNSCEKIRGFKVTRLGKVRYSEQYLQRQDPWGRPYYWMSGEPVILDHAPDCDIVAVHAGYVSVTPLAAELTDFNHQQALAASSCRLAAITEV